MTAIKPYCSVAGLSKFCFASNAKDGLLMVIKVNAGSSH